MRTTLIQLLMFAGVCLGVLSRAGLAQVSEPSPENPFGHLDRAGVVPASKGMYDAVSKVEQALQELTKRISKEPAPDSKEMAKMYMLVGQLNRWLAFLDHYREPAVVDWRMRAGIYHQMLLDVRNRYYATPAAAKARQTVLKQLTNSQPSRLKALGKTRQTLQSGEPKQAENQIEKIQSEVLSISGVLPDGDKKPYYDPMLEVVAAVSGPMSKFRSRETAEAEQAEKSKLAELSEALLATLTNGSGVEGLLTAGNQWKAVHLQRLRVYAFTNTAGSYGGDSDFTSSAAARPTGGNQGQDDGMAWAKTGIVDYLAREANNASPTNGLEHYLAFQQILAELTLRADDSAWTTALERSLEGLAKKCQVSSDVYNYRLATDELLRWRQRTATEWAQNMPGETLPTIAHREMASTDTFAGLYEKNQQTVLPLLLKPIPDLVPDIQSRLAEKAIRTAKVVPLDGTDSAAWTTRIDDGFYCNIAQNPIRELVAPLLRKELLCEGGNKPLSLQAAAALLSADVGLCEAAGGIWNGFALEAYVSRLCNVPVSHSNMVALGTLGPELRGDAKRFLLLRCELQPSWMQHKYFLYINNSK